MKVVLAISGGVDSMVLLDIFGSAELLGRAKTDNEMCIMVATFDHGTRPSAKDDAEFVRKKCIDYNLECYVGQGELGEGASEEVARESRYKFLRGVAEGRDNDAAVIYTAHHLDDLVESVAINLIRGTGWRGLAALDTPGIRRPFLETEYMPNSLQDLVPFDKKAIQKYAANFEIDYRQDPTNYEDNYLRNRVREKLNDFNEKQAIYELWRKQKELKHEIDKLVAELLPKRGAAWQRSWFDNLDEKVALELLRAGALQAGISATRPQLQNFLKAIRTYAPGKSFNLPNDKLVKFSKSEFYLD